MNIRKKIKNLPFGRSNLISLVIILNAVIAIAVLSIIFIKYTEGGREKTKALTYDCGSHTDNGNGTCTVEITDINVDGEIQHLFDMYNRRLTDNWLEFQRSNTVYYRSFVEWDVSDVPDGVDVSDVTLEYECNDEGADDSRIVSLNDTRPSTATNQGLYEDIGVADHSKWYVNPWNPTVGTQQTQDLGSTAESDLEDQLGGDWFAIGFKNEEVTSNDGDYIDSENAINPDPAPTLVVTYTPLNFYYQVDSLDSGLDVYNTGDNEIETGTDYGVVGTDDVSLVLNKNRNLKIADFKNVNFSSDLTWSNVSADSDLDNKKTFIDISGSLEGFSGSFDMYVPKDGKDDAVYYCPNANSLSEVQLGCAGGFEIENGQTENGITLSTVSNSYKCQYGQIDNGDGTCSADIDSVNEDASIEKIGANYTKKAGENEITFGLYNPASTYRAYIEWDVSHIPPTSTINDVVLNYHGKTNGLDIGAIYGLNSSQPSSLSAQSIYTNSFASATEYVDLWNVSPGTDKTQDLGSEADSELQSQLSDEWYAIGFKQNEVVEDGHDDIYSSEYGSADPSPTLQVEYEKVGATIALWKLEGVSGSGALSFSHGCGDLFITGSEECDDGDLDNNDGCSSGCQIEAGWECSGTPSVCEASACGDGYVVGDEECDDKNSIDNDGCTDCEVDPGWVCLQASTTSKSICNEICGDKKIVGDEICDSNSRDCSSNGYNGKQICNDTCDGWKICSLSESCGDGTINGEEECDDGNTSSNDGCDSECLLEEEVDEDEDDLPDGWERSYKCLKVGENDAAEDPDEDTLTNLEEYELETNPCDADTDDGGVDDGREVERGSDPLKKKDDKTFDSDGDGLSDYKEYEMCTDYEDSDTDDDSYLDGYEVKEGTDPCDPNDYPQKIKGDDEDKDNESQDSQQKVDSVQKALNKFLDKNVTKAREFVKENDTEIASAFLASQAGAITLSFSGIVFFMGNSALNLSVLLDAFLVLFNIKKKKSWGIVYDSKTKNPVSLSMINVMDSKGKYIKREICDMYGRYLLVVDKGRYRCEAMKSDYKKKFFELAADKTKNVMKDIGLDPVKSRFSINLKSTVLKISTLLTKSLIFGVYLVYLAATIVQPTLLNVSITLFASALLVYYAYMLKKRNVRWGTVINSRTKEPISNAYIRLFNRKTKKLIDIQVSDNKGRFGFIVNPGKYYILATAVGFKFPSEKQKYSKNMEKDKNIINVNITEEKKVEMDILLDPGSKEEIDTEKLKSPFSE